MLMRVDGPAIDALVSLATYNHDESIFGVEDKARNSEAPVQNPKIHGLIKKRDFLL